MKRGEVWTVAGGGDYAGKPRPVVVVQSDAFDATASVVVCGFTTNPAEALLFRVAVEPSAENGLDRSSHLMVDKITSVKRSRLRTRVGVLEDSHIASLNVALSVFLGLAAPGG